MFIVSSKTLFGELEEQEKSFLSTDPGQNVTINDELQSPRRWKIFETEFWWRITVEVEKEAFENNEKSFFPECSFLLNINMKCGDFIQYFLCNSIERNHADA